MNARQAAKQFATDTEKITGFKPDIWNKTKCAEMGYSQADAAVNIEGCGFETADIRPLGKQPYDGIYTEPHNNYLQFFYTIKISRKV